VEQFNEFRGRISELIETRGGKMAFAELSDLNGATISRLLKGTIKPSPSVLRSILTHISDDDEFGFVPLGGIVFILIHG